MRRLFLVITNISKKPNVVKLIQVAIAYDCKGILIVGQKNFDVERDVPVSLHTVALPLVHRFAKWHECVDFCTANEIRLMGVEIHPEAQPVEAFFDSTTDLAVVIGNEGTGLHEKQMQSCQGFCRIPQYGGGTASLNVYVAASIVLYRLHMDRMSRSG